MVDIHDYDIRLIEEEIMMKYGRPPHYNPNYDCLLSLRKIGRASCRERV